MCRVGLYHVPPLDLLDVAGTVTRGNTWGKTFIKESSCLGVGACSIDGDGFSCWSVEEQGEWRRLGEMIIKIKVLIPGGGPTIRNLDCRSTSAPAWGPQLCGVSITVECSSSYLKLSPDFPLAGVGSCTRFKIS